MECNRCVLTGHVSETCLVDNNVHGLGLSIKRYLRQEATDLFSVFSLCPQWGILKTQAKPFHTQRAQFCFHTPFLTLLDYYNSSNNLGRGSREYTGWKC